MFINNFIQLIGLILLTKGQPTNFTNAEELTTSKQAMRQWDYPIAPRDEGASDVFWGKTVQDPYRPLTKPLDPNTLNYIEESNAFTNKMLELDTTRSETRKAILRLGGLAIEYNKVKIGGFKYALYNPGDYDQFIITRQYWEGQRETIVDPTLLFEKGTTKILNFSISKSGKYMAYVISRKGSDWQSIYIMDLVYRTQVGEILWTKHNSNIEWEQDESGFFYRAYAPANGITFDQAGLETEPSKLLGYYRYYIRNGRTQIFNIQNLDDTSGYQNHKLISINDRYMLAILQNISPESNDSNSGSKARLIELQQNTALAKDFVLSTDGDHYIKYLKSDEEGMEFITDIGAPNRHIIKVNFDSLDKYEVIVSELPDGMPTHVIDYGKKRVIFFSWDGISFAGYIEGPGEQPKEINVPFGVASNPIFSDDGSSITFELSSFLHYSQKYKYDFNTKAVTLLSTFDHPAFNSNQFEQYRALYTARDGAEIPILIAHRKGIKPNQSRAGFLYGYGGFKDVQHPNYNPFWAYLLQEKDMVLAIALVRGGSERGDIWRQDGILLNKHRSYSDYADAVEFLHKDPKYGFVGAKMQFINGASNGGLLTSATCNLIPEKLGGCIADVGVHDLLRYKQWTAGAGWESDYGFPEHSKEQFSALMKISPLENVLPPTNGTQTKFYPPYLINTADYDDRVSPLHTLKLAATIQNSHRNSPNPTLLYIARNSGHSPSSLTKSLDKDVNAVSLINIALNKLY